MAGTRPSSCEGFLKILLLDIETAPNCVYTWGLREQNIAINQIQASSYTLCWSAKWYGDGKVMFDSVMKSSPKRMIQEMHALLCEAEVVITYNGASFDLPTLNKEFLLMGKKPPSPYKHIDLYQVVKRNLRFQSNKLDYITQTLGIGSKVKHKGMELWQGCMARKEADWKVMEKYNKRDVTLLEDLYELIRPWIKNHPNRSLAEEALICPRCGSHRYRKDGFTMLRSGTYQQYQCAEKLCGGWFRSSVRTGERVKEHYIQT